MQKLITVNEFISFKDVDKKADVKKIEQSIEMAQISDLKSHLGDRFYFELISNSENPIYQDLLSGSTFSYYDVNYYQDGIKSFLADLTMAKYSLSVNTNFTPFGATTKVSQDSETTDRNTLKDISTQQLQLAGSKWETIKIYLDSNTSMFPNWQNNTLGSSDYRPSERTFRFRII